MFATGVTAIALGIYAETGFSGNSTLPQNDSVNLAVEKGVKWLVSVQGIRMAVKPLTSGAASEGRDDVLPKCRSRQEQEGNGLAGRTESHSFDQYS